MKCVKKDILPFSCILKNNVVIHLGSFSYESLLDTEKSLATAEQSYITAVYDFMVAKINFQKAIGNL